MPALLIPYTNQGIYQDDGPIIAKACGTVDDFKRSKFTTDNVSYGEIKKCLHPSLASTVQVVLPSKQERAVLFKQAQKIPEYKA